MTPDLKIVKSIEKLDYRVTVGDVAAQAGLELNFTQQGLLALASEAGGHLQVAESGDVVYLFPKNFRSILRNKYWQLRWQQTWQKIWRVLFYLIRISFGVILIASILLMLVAILVIVIAMNSTNDEGEGDDRNYGTGYGGGFFMPRFWIGDIFWWFDPGYNHRRQSRRKQTSNYQMNFLESVFSFLFGDGDPNADLEADRWQEIGSVIRNSQGAVIGEQIAPYIDDMDQDEDYMIPVLSRFNGYPQVSPQGEIIYYFPELQVMASRRQGSSVATRDFLQAKLWSFSQANGSQITLAAGLGALNIILAFVLETFLQDGSIATQLGGIVAFADSISWFLLSYGVLYLVIPLVRYFWIQGRNPKLVKGNQAREQRAIALHQPDQFLVGKLAYASQFAQQKVISDRDLAYTTEDDLLDQNLKNTDKIDQDWQKRISDQ
jgi:hypothetical protein